MQRSHPKYRINYNYCQEIGHVQEKTNLICMQKACNQNALICSFCIEEKHQGHSTMPLKHFLEKLQAKYSNQTESYRDQKLYELQNQKYVLLDNIKKAVQSISSSFQELQEEVFKQYQIIKSQIISQEINKKRFNQFYHFMAYEGKGDQNFEINNFLRFEPIISFNLTNQIEELANNTNKKLQEIKQNIVIQNKEEIIFIKCQPLVKITAESEQKIIIPSSIKRTGNFFSQCYITSKQTVCYLSKYLKDWTGKIRIKVINLQQMANLTIGVAQGKDLIDSQHQFTFKNNPKSFHLDSKGAAFNYNNNFISAIKTGDIIDVLIKKNKMKISLKGNTCNFNLGMKQKSMFFFSMQGACQIEFIYPYKKEK